MPRLLMWCQHALGMGHLVRSYALAAGLAERFDVVLVAGGHVPEGIAPPPGVRIVPLPAVAAEDGDWSAVGTDRGLMHARTAALLAAFDEHRPDVLVVELFPFGRKRFTGELVSLLMRAHALGDRRPLVACVGARHPGRRAARPAAPRPPRAVHGRPLVRRSCWCTATRRSRRSRTPSRSRSRSPVHHTGFVVARPRRPAHRGRTAGCVVASAGGGAVGEPLLTTALQAQALLAGEGYSLRAIAGPLLPADALHRLARPGGDTPGAELVARRARPRDRARPGRRLGQPVRLQHRARGRRRRRAGDRRAVRRRPRGRAGPACRRGSPRSAPCPCWPAGDLTPAALAARSARCAARPWRRWRSRWTARRAAPSCSRPRSGCRHDLAAPVEEALDRRAAPVDVFFRDDDAGWDDDALAQLLDLFELHGLPVDVAVIPRALDAAPGGAASSSGTSTLHQHGFAHVSHERTGRSCEFGRRAPPADIRGDIVAGRARARRAARRRRTCPSSRRRGTGAARPPAPCWSGSDWCCRARAAPSRSTVPGLAELPIDVDWHAKRRGVPLTRDEIAEPAGRRRSPPAAGSASCSTTPPWTRRRPARGRPAARADRPSSQAAHAVPMADLLGEVRQCARS